MRMIIKYGAMLIALCINFGHIKAMDTDKDYREEIARLSKLPPNKSFSPKSSRTELSQAQAIWLKKSLEKYKENTDGNILVLKKMGGKPQHTGTDGHGTTSLREALDLAQNPHVKHVDMNKKLYNSTHNEVNSGKQPDVIAEYDDGMFGMTEIISGTESYDSEYGKIVNLCNAYPQYFDINRCKAIFPYAKTSPDINKYKYGRRTTRFRSSPQKIKF